MALRTQIVQYVTSGVRSSIRRVNLIPPKKSGFVDIFNGSFKSKKDPAVVSGLEVLEFLLEGEYPFKFFAPGLFETVPYIFIHIHTYLFVCICTDIFLFI
jgi:hypothetical protein